MFAQHASALSRASTSVSAHAVLRAATRPSHRRLEKRLNIAQRFGDPSAYRAHIKRMWGFCAGLERCVEPTLAGGALRDFPKRRKLPLLERDLEFLGMSLESIERLPRCETLPAWPDEASAFGCLYVLEGATLGGRTLVPLVKDRLGYTDRQGASFLASYGDDTPEMWGRFIDALECCCADEERRGSAAAAASSTFTELERWLCGSEA